MENTTNNIIEVLESKQFCKNGIPYPSPSELLTPIIDMFNNENITGFGSHPVTVAENEIELTAYGRAGIVKTFDIDGEMNYNIGFIYSLEYSRPFIKVFSGINVKICSNMCIFNSDNLEKIDLLSEGTQKAYQKVQNFLINQERNCKDAIEIIKRMKATQLTYKETQDFFGRLLFNFSKVKNVAGTQTILKASSLLNNKSSHYYIADNLTTAWNVYNSLTDDFREKSHIIDHPEKVWNIFKEIEQGIEFNNIDDIIEIQKEPLMIE